MYQYDYNLEYYRYYQEQLRKQRVLRMRRTYSAQGWILLVYLGIMYASLFVVAFLDVFFGIANSIAQTGTMDFDIDVDRLLNSSGWGYLLAGVAGFVVLLFWKKPKFTFDLLCRRNKPMKAGCFIQILSIFMTVQLVYILLASLAEYVFNQFGYTIASEGITYDDNLSMLLYVGLGAPVTEELLFRGLILRSMEPYGKKFAIFASALLFGLFHGNLSQGLFAFAAGLVMGYVALEYNLFWAMVLHMFNNLIISDSLTRISRWLPEGTDRILLLIILGIFAVIAMVSIGVDYKKFWAYLKKEKDDPDCAKAFWSAAGIVVLMVVMGLTILSAVSTAVVPL